ncbi:hypothetical protein B9Z55_011621 [Caenorhabditis nigoni]|uniref:C2H2-type domain-containing protein n=1 Tax=Caenorhabditis nigoni TaxID=1611254 RepID=A0A2G5UL53_9PELO|nr:hypothetical protein B9Z55_011621 [Caenorhabditis nigoni]
MAHLVCPMCSETLSEEGSHFFKHFKYKRYACGENDCTHQFYTEAERNAHCSANNHKRSFQLKNEIFQSKITVLELKKSDFQCPFPRKTPFSSPFYGKNATKTRFLAQKLKTVNPYIDRMITQLVEDAKHLATTNDMEVVIANRWERRDSESHSEILKTSEVVKQRKKRVTSSSSTTPVTKKTRTTPAVKISTSPFAFLSSSSATSGAATSSSSNINPPTPPTPSPTNTVQPAPSSSAIVDSTTSDHNIPVPPAPPAPSTTRKPRNQRQSESCSTGPHNQTYEEMSALDKLIGWFDPNVPERQDAAKIKCSVCHKEIVYDYIIRKGHVTRDHMAADIAPQDYDDILKTTMDRCYPEMPNSSLACQLCMTGSDVRKTLRREHIEKFHTTSLPPLTCPMDGCGKGFRRQCDLSSHMKEIHKAKMSIHKDQTFQNIRRRRNGMINEMINKCFPWSSLEAMENKAIALLQNKSASTPSLATPTDLSKDVRIRDANKTRRAPQYNTTGSSSSSSSSDSEDESTTLATVEDPNGTPIDFSRDVIYICHQFNAEVAQKLSQRIAPMLVKREARAEDVVLNDEPMEEEPEDVKEEEEQSREEMEVPKVEDVVQS